LRICRRFAPRKPSSDDEERAAEQAGAELVPLPPLRGDDEEHRRRDVIVPDTAMPYAAARAVDDRNETTRPIVASMSAQFTCGR